MNGRKHYPNWMWSQFLRAFYVFPTYSNFATNSEKFNVYFYYDYVCFKAMRHEYRPILSFLSVREISNTNKCIMLIRELNVNHNYPSFMRSSGYKMADIFWQRNHWLRSEFWICKLGITNTGWLIIYCVEIFGSNSHCKEVTNLVLHDVLLSGLFSWHLWGGEE